MDYLTFLLAIFHAYKALCGETFWDTTVQLAENMTLECVYPFQDTLTQMEWFKINATQKESVAIFHPSFGIHVREAYHGRVHFLNSNVTPSDMTLSFLNATEADMGLYSCLLHTFPRGSWEKVVQVVSPGSFETAVSSDKHVLSKPGGNITLTCPLHMKWPLQEVRWEKIQPHQIDLLTNCNLSQGRSYALKYRRQVESNCSEEASSSIVLPLVTASDSGLYRCLIKASTGENDTYVLRLTVTHGKMDYQYILFIVGGAVILSLFVILITAAIVISCHRRRKRKQVLFEETWDTQNKAMNNSRNPISVKEPPDGTTEDIYVNYPTFSRRPKTRIQTFPLV
ncbi:PREDICTED: CD226 antigen [Condylura cristata]|uniref:CD226 antigen n=1 Tax=Condylura cristata TaxID=143302 RepID=UPI0003344D65|nr:PREDICTED: CD226 antigen [Condylura cristata]